MDQIIQIQSQLQHQNQPNPNNIVLFDLVNKIGTDGLGKVRLDDRQKEIEYLILILLYDFGQDILNDYSDVLYETLLAAWLIGDATFRQEVYDQLKPYLTAEEKRIISREGKVPATLLAELRNEARRVGVTILEADKQRIARELAKDVRDGKSRAEMEKTIQRYFEKPRATDIETKDIMVVVGIRAIRNLIVRTKIVIVTWVVNMPKDTLCLMNAGLEREYGKPFPSGNTSPQVHRFCQCILVPKARRKDIPNLIKVL